MEKDELKQWFIDKWNSCYAVINDDYPERIYMCYDTSVARKMKLCKLNNVEFKLDKVTGVYLFQQDYTNNYLWCDYDNIWLFLENNYSYNYTDIQKFIKCILEEQDKLTVLTPTHLLLHSDTILEEKNKLSVLTPLIEYRLEEKDKLTVLIPQTN